MNEKASADCTMSHDCTMGHVWEGIPGGHIYCVRCDMWKPCVVCGDAASSVQGSTCGHLACMKTYLCIGKGKQIAERLVSADRQALIDIHTLCGEFDNGSIMGKTRGEFAERTLGEICDVTTAALDTERKSG